MTDLVSMLSALTALITALAGLVSATAALMWCARQERTLSHQQTQLSECLLRHQLPAPPAPPPQ